MSNIIDEENIYEKYRVFIDNLENKFSEIAITVEQNWDGVNIQILIKNLTKMALQLRKLCDDLKKATGEVRLKIYYIVVSNIIHNHILLSGRILGDDKLLLESAFGTDGVVESVIEEVSQFYNEILIQMDQDSNNYVSSEEYRGYLTSKLKCCCGENSNCSTSCKQCCTGFAKCTSCAVTSTCFPLLSCCNKKGIQIKN